MKSRVLYISYDGMTDPLGQSQVIPYVQGLAAKGYKFTILSCEKPLMYEKYKDTIEEILNASGIRWKPVMYHRNPKILSTIYDFLHLKRVAVRLHRETPFQLIHCRSYISTLVGLHLKKKHHVPFIFDMRGFWADERVDGGLWNLENPIYKLIYTFFKNKEKEFFEKSAAVISLTEAGKREMLSWEAVQISNPPIYVIPCSTDLSVFAPVSEEDKQRQKKRLGIKPDQRVLSYLGSIGTWYMLPQMLDFFKIFLKSFPDAVFLFITPDNERYIRMQARERNIPEEKILIKFVPRKEVASMVSVSDASIFFIKPSYSKISSSPTKLGELLAMDLPVICNSGVGDVKEIVEYTQGGAIVSAFKDEEYQKATLRINSILASNTKPLKEKVLEYFDLKKAVNSYYSIYNSIID